ncbi:type II toxin-antitoxin system RelE/ParE family toxin [Myceligenerans crystallogenes]|uniref:Addiction module toxin RelE n=1 Tax=Myceligenerans crystallogenes TaxID=316335 RepID=A0ABN2NI72_9MICO
MEEWDIQATDEFRQWFNTLDRDTKLQLTDAIDLLAERGPQLGQPLVDRIEGSQLHNMKELRPGSKGNTEIRALFAFDPWRSAILLIGGDKSGKWSSWYRIAIPQAERLFAEYLKERGKDDSDE